MARTINYGLARAFGIRYVDRAWPLSRHLFAWYLENLLEDGRPDAYEDLGASWDASRGDAPAWDELPDAARCAYAGKWAANCANWALSYLTDETCVDCAPDGSEVWEEVCGR